MKAKCRVHKTPLPNLIWVVLSLAYTLTPYFLKVCSVSGEVTAWGMVLIEEVIVSQLAKEVAWSLPFWLLDLS
jgi:hypothetical protein